MSVRVVVVDDHALFRAGLISLLEEMPDIKVVGEAEDGLGALSTVSESKPDVLLLDVNMPGMNGVEVVEVLQKWPQEDRCKILMLTISKSELDLISAISAGADGYLLKDAEPEELRKAIFLVNEGNSVLSPKVTRQVINKIRVSPVRSMTVNLSKREMEVLNCLAAGFNNMEIANELVISENTVKTHVRHILEKFSASNRTEAVSKAAQMGLISDQSQ
jgi:DNA-binding NarL/FixJ family response regulator